MLNDPSNQGRRPHPLEQRPTPPPQSPQPQRPQVTLHIPTVKPYVTYAFLAINIAVFVLRALSPEIDLNLFLWGANHQPEVIGDGQYYRLLSSMFLHASIFDGLGRYNFSGSLHLIFNAYALYIFGTSVERFFGHLRFALVYLLGGLGGSVLSVVLGGPDTYSVGASGAVFAIFGAEFIFLYQHRKLLGAAGRARMQNLVVMGVMNLAIGVLSSFGGSRVRIDNWAHLGGLIGGMALTWFIGPFFLVRQHPDYTERVELIGEDNNPINKRWWAVSLYVTALLAILIAGTFLIRS
jgi:rhomboid protease GluP